MEVRTVRYITPLAPDHQGGGGHRRVAHLLDEMARRWEVELVVADELRDEAVRAAVSRVLSVPPVRVRSEPGPGRRFTDLRLAVFGPFHREVQAHAEVRRSIGRLLADRPEPDLVCVELAALAPLLPRRRQAHWALTLQNLGSVMAVQRSGVAHDRRNRWRESRDAGHARRFERWVVGAYDTLAVVSDEDSAVIDPSGDRTVVVVPNGVDLARFRPTRLPEQPRVVLVGALYTKPNSDGAVWFCREILPLVRADIPGCEAVVVGMRPPPEVLALAGLPGVAVHPDVPAVEPYVEAARVAVVPLRIGSGSRLKALEAMAAGRPVVGTTIGLGGLRFEPGRHALVADEPGEFARAVVSLLRDDARACKQAAEARQLVEERHGWSAIASDYADLLSERVSST